MGSWLGSLAHSFEERRGVMLQQVGLSFTHIPGWIVTLS